MKTNLIIPTPLKDNLTNYLDLTMGKNPINKRDAINGYFNLINPSKYTDFIELFETSHTDSYSSGIMIKDALITGDVKNCDNLLERYKKAKIIFHDSFLQIILMEFIHSIMSF